MTLAGRRDGEPAGYLEIALAIVDHVEADGIESDLEPLFRRVAFNVLARNWRLAPVFDLNPGPRLAEHTLALDGLLRIPDLDLVRESAPSRCGRGLGRGGGLPRGHCIGD